MKVALIDVDSRIPNFALMKLARYHRDKGDVVELHQPLERDYDLAYASKIFSFSPEYPYWPECETVKGGTGYDLTTALPREVENLRPDYSIYPDCDYAMGFTTRGCIRNCEFCVVPRKEGKLRRVGDLYDIWEGQSKLMLLDNNLTADREHFATVASQCIKERILVDFTQGLDLRLLTVEQARLLAKVRLWKSIHFAWDNIRDETLVRQGISRLVEGGVSLHKCLVYVLIGYNSTPDEDLYRVETLRALRALPFVMPFDKTDSYQRRFARWVNHKAVFKTVPWSDYGKRPERQDEHQLALFSDTAPAWCPLRKEKGE